MLYRPESIGRNIPEKKLVTQNVKLSPSRVIRVLCHGVLEARPRTTFPHGNRIRARTGTRTRGEYRRHSSERFDLGVGRSPLQL